MMVTASLPQVRVAWSPATVVMLPKRRTVDVDGCADGAKAWRCEGRMRGVEMEPMMPGCNQIAAE